MKKKEMHNWETRLLLWIIIFILMGICHRVDAQSTDIKLLRTINTPHKLLLDGMFKGVSNSVYFVVVGVPLTIGTIGTIKHENKYLETTIFLISSTAVTMGLTDILKYKFNRERPFYKYPDILNKSGVYNLDPSFPSGHTASTFNTATLLSLYYPKWYIIVPSFIYAGSVGYSRMYLGVHYPSDVLAGAVLGAGTAWLTYYIDKKLFCPKYKVNGNRKSCK
jgi:membrane-associated phospholipid phosphatase